MGLAACEADILNPIDCRDLLTGTAVSRQVRFLAR